MYFGCSPLLTVAQATFLAALPQRPSAYNPYKIQVRRAPAARRIIDSSCTSGQIDPDEAAHGAARTSFAVEPRHAHLPRRISWKWCWPLRADSARLGSTTLDASLQSKSPISSMRIVRRCCATARTTSRWSCSTTTTAEWLAWEGSGDYFDGDETAAPSTAASRCASPAPH